MVIQPRRKEEAIKHEHREDEEAENLPDTTDMHGQHLFDANCKICTGKLVPVTETTPTKSTVCMSVSLYLILHVFHSFSECIYGGYVHLLSLT